MPEFVSLAPSAPRSVDRPDARYFSANYSEARSRFRLAAAAAGATRHSYDLNIGAPDALTIDVAILGADDAPTLLLSSGVHGIEGFFGSAVQLSLLERLAAAPPRGDVRYVLIHAVNPFGFERLRRTNEDNVDLNRNFVLRDDPYHGSPAGYAELDAFLNPKSAPSWWEPFRLKALWQIRRHGLQALKNAVAGGQYDFAQGLFYGGAAPALSTQIVGQHCDAWIADAPFVIHIDLHTGLGAYAQPTLLLNETREAPHYTWYDDVFGGHRIEPLTDSPSTAYRASGPFGRWMQQHFDTRPYRFVGVEFGTYDVIRLLAALRAENRAHHYGTHGAPAYVRAKRELLECFCPAAPAWRRDVLQQAGAIIALAEKSLAGVGKQR